MVGGIWGQTRYVGARVFGWPDLSKRRLGGPSLPRHPNMGTDTMSGIPIRNVQRETFNSQLLNGVTERALGGWDMGTDTRFGRLKV